MKLTNSTIVALAVAGGFSLTAYVMGQAPGPATSGPATSMPTNPAQNIQGQSAQGLNTRPQAGNTIGPISSATIEPHFMRRVSASA